MGLQPRTSLLHSDSFTFPLRGTLQTSRYRHLQDRSRVFGDFRVRLSASVLLAGEAKGGAWCPIVELQVSAECEREGGKRV